MKFTIKIDEELSNYIEGLQYESNRTKEIMAFMLSISGYDVHTDTFKAWDRDNQKAYAELSIAKNKLEKEVILVHHPELKARPFGWNLDFYTHEVTVEAANA